MSYVTQQYFKYGNGLQIANLITIGFDTTIILAIQNDPSTQLHKSVRFQTTHLVKLLLLSPKIHPQAAFNLASRPLWLMENSSLFHPSGRQNSPDTSVRLAH